MKIKCWVCTGHGNSLCRDHNHARQERMAKFNIDSDTAVEQLREMYVDLLEEVGLEDEYPEGQTVEYWGTERTI
jgi:hypothetical protein